MGKNPCCVSTRTLAPMQEAGCGCVGACNPRAERAETGGLLGLLAAGRAPFQ